MAKQQTMSDIVPKIPVEVEVAAEGYLKHKRAIAASREKMNAALDALILRMHEAGLEEILIDDGDKRLVLDTKEGVKITKRKKDEGEIE